MALASVAVLVTMGLGAIAVAGGATAREQAGSTAELAALAAARVDRDKRVGGVSDRAALRAACSAAADVTASNGGHLIACARAASHSVLITVAIDSPWGDAKATARAGAVPAPS